MRKNTNMSINVSPSQWGPKIWKSLHYIAYAYPDTPNEAQKQAAMSLVMALRELLPCEKCRGHYSTYVGENPPNVDSRTEFAKYLHQMHNQVNARLGKESFPFDLSRPYAKKDQGWDVGQILFIVLIGVMLGVLLKAAWSKWAKR